MRAIWKGSISFGLVNIPVGVYPATREEKISFKQLRARDLSPIRYKKVAEADHIEQKVQHREPKAPPVKPRRGDKVVDLLAVLQESLQKAGKKETKAAPAAKGRRSTTTLVKQKRRSAA